MKHYINSQNQILGFDESQADIIPTDCVLIPSSYTIDQYQYLSVTKGEISFNQDAYDLSAKSHLIGQYESSAQSNLDSVAQSWGYDSVVSAVSYANSTIAQFKAEAVALIEWRDAVWSSAYTLLANVQAGKKLAPKTVDEFLALLPIAPGRPV